MVMKDSMTESVLNLICRWQLKLDPADATEEALSEFLQDCLHKIRRPESWISGFNAQGFGRAESG